MGPKLHGGMVLKHNANQRYATNAVTAFFFREAGRRHNLCTQEFAVRLSRRVLIHSGLSEILISSDDRRMMWNHVLEPSFRCSVWNW